MSEDQINRGGGWGTDSQYARVVVRDVLYPEFRLDDLGFRLVFDGADRVFRGGISGTGPRGARVAGSGSDNPAYRFLCIGFRLTRGDT